MSFQASDFLAGLYGERPPAIDADKSLGPEVASPGDLTADANGEPPSFDLSGWVRRADCQGRMGWEPPDLPEADRWWAEYDFDDLPEADWACRQCGGLLWWEDLVEGKHCLECEADKAERADRLAVKAAELRRLNPPPTEAGPAASEHVGEPSGSPLETLPWPGALADWTMLLTPDDLPERFTLRRGVEIVDTTRFLTSLQRGIRRGPSGPRVRYGALQSDLAALHSVLLGGQTTAPAKPAL